MARACGFIMIEKVTEKSTLAFLEVQNIRRLHFSMSNGTQGISAKAGTFERRMRDRLLIVILAREWLFVVNRGGRRRGRAATYVVQLVFFAGSDWRHWTM